MMDSKATIRCKKCGASVPVNRMYCMECGAELDHDLGEVQSSVDAENRLEKVRNLRKTIRWFLVASLVLTIGGCYFRRAYRRLPENTVVAFAAAPTVGVETETSVETRDFLIPMPEPAKPHVPDVAEDPNLEARLIDAALQRAMVSVRKRDQRSNIHVLLIGDTVLFLPVEGKDEPRPVHVADLRRLRPIGPNRWQIWARGLDEPATLTLDQPSKVRLKMLERRDDGREVVQTVPLDEIHELKPL